MLALSRLESLRVTREAHGVAATDLQQLSSLPRLADVQLSYQQAHRVKEALAAAWGTLPLKEPALRGHKSKEVCWRAQVSVGKQGVSGAVVQHLSALQRLTCLVLKGCCSFLWHGPEDTRLWPPYSTTPAQLALVLQPLTALRSLEVSRSTAVSCIRGADVGPQALGRPQTTAADSAPGVAACVEAVCSLPALTRLHVDVPVWLDSIAEQQLASITVTRLLQLDTYWVRDEALFMVME